MILTCSSCSARYLVAATVFAAGPRQVRCARCGYSWQADLPPEAMAAAQASAEAVVSQQAPSAWDSGAASAPKPPLTEPPETIPPIPEGSNVPALRKKPIDRKIWIGGMILAGVVLLTILLILLLNRHDLTQRWPQLQGFYESLGLGDAGNSGGLSLRQIKSERRFEDGGMKLVIEGEIHNEGKEPEPVPPLQASALGPGGQIMHSWQIDPPAMSLPQDGTMPFRSAITTPPGTVDQITLSFAPRPSDHE